MTSSRYFTATVADQMPQYASAPLNGGALDQSPRPPRQKEHYKCHSFAVLRCSQSRTTPICVNGLAKHEPEPRTSPYGRRLLLLHTHPLYASNTEQGL